MRRSRFPRIAFASAAVYNLLFGLILLLTVGLRGWAGTGGDDNLLFVIIGYVSIVMLLLGTLGIALAVRPHRGTAADVGSGLVVVGILLIIFALFPFGLPEVILGVVVLRARKRL